MGAVAEPSRKEIVLPITRGFRIAALLVLSLLLIGGAAVGAYLVGQGTRKSDAQVAREQHAAVTKAVGAKSAADHALLVQTVNERVAAQKAHDKKVTHSVAVRLK